MTVRSMPSDAAMGDDPLHASPLRTLDAGGALGLVLEHIDEDDVLCAALACSTFRDALLQPPVAPQKAALAAGWRGDGAAVGQSAGHLAFLPAGDDGAA
eukprot:COSAG06_NODE_2380_length_6981_cov_38.221738_4_plen_99_part_00